MYSSVSTFYKQHAYNYTQDVMKEYAINWLKPHTHTSKYKQPFIIIWASIYHLLFYNQNNTGKQTEGDKGREMINNIQYKVVWKIKAWKGDWFMFQQIDSNFKLIIININSHTQTYQKIHVNPIMPALKRLATTISTSAQINTELTSMHLVAAQS